MVAVSYMFVMGRSTANNLFSARVVPGANPGSAAPLVTIGRIKFDISGLIPKRERRGMTTWGFYSFVNVHEW